MVVLANHTGFDGTPVSLRNLRLEYGAEIGRAIVNFEGSVVFCVISRYHGGAFVVFSKALNDNMTVLALGGSYASVIGGAPAAVVVFGRQVDGRAEAAEAVRELAGRLEAAEPEQVPRLAEEYRVVRAGGRNRVPAEFDAAAHTIGRVVAVGSEDEIISPARWRPRVIEVLDDWNRSRPGAAAAVERPVDQAV
ncbi:carboxyl transferase domain-containing protein [Amycolatopsis anabasis]|uniref:carboxyl transferase domain-containing protein n=1 Tax=Amycolatopsis anabasis TaxID=1840409 RepID=UPI0031B5F59B